MTYTVADMAVELSVSRSVIYARLSLLDMRGLKIKNGQTTMRIFTEEEFEIIKTLIEQEQIIEHPKTKKIDIEEMRKLHPLVTNDNFFNTSYFPDVKLDDID